jgi:hypothetical protein
MILAGVVVRINRKRGGVPTIGREAHLRTVPVEATSALAMVSSLRIWMSSGAT